MSEHRAYSVKEVERLIDRIAELEADLEAANIEIERRSHCTIKEILALGEEYE